MPDVIALAGWPPEVMAYAFAMYSRSALSIRESIEKITSEKSSNFLETFYFKYGHASIADNAHIATACENVSQIATYEAEDEELWDGQERSTRYQKFGVGKGYLVPKSIRNTPLESAYHDHANYLLKNYDFFSQKVFEHLVKQNPKPADMKDASYERNLRARAFDVARYFLFGGILTSFGQIVKARVLEGQISRLMSSEYPESRELGETLKLACTEKPFCPADRNEPPVAPTLVKYAKPNDFRIALRISMHRQAKNLLTWESDSKSRRYVKIARLMPIDLEVASTLLYEESQYPYGEIFDFVSSMPERLVDNILESALEHRGQHDQLPKAFAAGHRIQFDIAMDRGGERDLHRHRNCIQIHQRLSVDRGFDRPAIIDEMELTEKYNGVMEGMAHTVRGLEKEIGVDAHYLIPFAYRTGTLYKMHLAQAVYMSELRSGIKGHFSYREVACQMHDQLAQRLPFLRKNSRVTPLDQVDPLTR